MSASDATGAAERRERLVELYREVADCTRCPLHATRTKAVFGAGDADAGLMFVGEAPGAEEDRQGLSPGATWISPCSLQTWQFGYHPYWISPPHSRAPTMNRHGPSSNPFLLGSARSDLSPSSRTPSEKCGSSSL